MVNKKAVVRNTLGGLLVVSLVGTGVLYNSIVSSKQALAKAEAQLKESKDRLQAVQGKALEVKGTNPDGTKYGSGWTEVNANEVPADPNKVLSSGMTLRDAKISIDSKTSFWKGQGLSDEQIKTKMSALATSYGTSLEEIASIPVSQATITPSTGGTTKSSGSTVKSSSGTKTSSGTSVSSGTTGSYEPTEGDKNGNGISDELEGYGIGSGTSTTYTGGESVHPLGEE